MDRLSVLCFAGTYALALVSELARFALHAGVRWVWTVGLIALGLVVHTLFLVNRGLTAHTVPLTTFFESMIVVGWVLAAIALYLALQSARRRPTVAGLFVLGLAFVVVTVAGTWASQAVSGADSHNVLTFWGSIHGMFQVLGAVFTCLAFVFGLLYMAQAWRLKHKRPAAGSFALPSLEQSERWHRAAISLAFPCLTAGLITGLGLVFATRRLQWYDPKIASTLAVWFIFAGLLHARYRPDWRGRRVMLLTIVAFAFLAFAMVGVGLVFPTQHGGMAARDAARSASAEALP